MNKSLLGIALLLTACGSSPQAIDAPPIPRDAPLDSPAGGNNLTVKNYLSWCSVTVNGGAASISAVQAVHVTPGTINLSATAKDSSFQLGTAPWHHTAGDTGAGEQGTVTGTGTAASSATTVVVGSTAKCVWVCCEFAGGGGCPTADQCP